MFPEGGREVRRMTELDIDAQWDRETATTGLENAARRYAAAFLGIAAGDTSQEQLAAALAHLVTAACTYAAIHAGQSPSSGELRR
jgi:hypothetical protein